MRRLDELPDLRVVEIAKKSRAGVSSRWPSSGSLNDWRKKEGSFRASHGSTLAEALNEFALAGEGDLVELLAAHWPEIEQAGRWHELAESSGLPGLSVMAALQNYPLADGEKKNSEILKQVGFLNCSQSKLFQFLEDVVHPSRRKTDAQKQIAAKLNPILRRDGYSLVHDGHVSGYPLYRVHETVPSGIHPADDDISHVLVSFDEIGVHNAWKKALDRKRNDPEGSDHSGQNPFGDSMQADHRRIR